MVTLDMKSLFQNFKKNKSGFTLVEVLVVLVIIGILLTLVVPSLTGWIDNAEEKKLTVACRTCVTAAQTLITEAYAAGEKSSSVVPSPDEVMRLAGIKTGTVSNITMTTFSSKIISGKNIYSNDMQVSTLTYMDEGGDSVTYLRDPNPHFGFSDPLEWEKGMRFEIGDIMLQTDTKGENPFLFRCMVAHTSGSRSNTRNPYVKSNKGSWEVIGTPDGKPAQYSHIVRFGIGVVVKCNGNLYTRTEYNLTGGQTPYSKSSSRYWTLIGPDPDA